MKPIWLHVARERSPNCQNMTFVSSTSSAKYWMMVEAPAKRAESATPTKMMLSGRSRPKRENASTTRLDIMAPAKAKRAVMPMFTLALEPVIAGTTIRIANVAPKPAPCEIPTVEAEASGFSSTLCSTAPAIASPAPEMMAHTTRGRRMPCTAAISLALP